MLNIDLSSAVIQNIDQTVKTETDQINKPDVIGNLPVQDQVCHIIFSGLPFPAEDQD